MDVGGGGGGGWRLRRFSVKNRRKFRYSLREGGGRGLQKNVHMMFLVHNIDT